MIEKDEGYELEQPERNSLHKDESTDLEGNKERKNYLEVIDIIESLMQDENFPLKDESDLTIKKILSFLDKEIYENQDFTEAWLIKGTVLYKTGKYDSAIEAFDGALETIPTEAMEERKYVWKKKYGISYRYALKFKAFSLCKLGRYEEAMDALNEISALYPSDSEIQEYKNILYNLEEEKLTEGRNDTPDKYPFQDNYPKGSVDWELKGKYSYESGNYEKALKEFDKALESNPKDADLWKYRGSTLYKLDKPEEALKAFDKALQKNPNIFEAWLNKGSILFELGRYRQALSTVENALRINPEDVNALNLRSSILYKLERKEE